MDIEKLMVRAMKEAMKEAEFEVASKVGEKNQQEPNFESQEYIVGRNYFMMTYTNYYTGQCVNVTPTHIWINQAAWIALARSDSGEGNNRFADAMKEGVFDEVEPYPPEMVIRIRNDGSLISSEWPYGLPLVQK